MPRSLGWFVASILFVTACGDREPAVTPGGASPAGLRGIEDAAGIPAARMDEIVDAFNRGISLMEQYRPSDAAAAFQSVVEMAPEWTLARLDLGIALLNEQTDESSARAEQELRRVATEVPDDPHAHHALGMLFRHLSRFAEARQEFERVLAIDPDDADAHYQLAILVIDDDQTAARTHLERTLARVPHHESACYRLQSLLRQAGETERADELLRRFSELKAAKAGVTAGMKYGWCGPGRRGTRRRGLARVAGGGRRGGTGDRTGVVRAGRRDRGRRRRRGSRPLPHRLGSRRRRPLAEDGRRIHRRDDDRHRRPRRGGRLVRRLRPRWRPGPVPDLRGTQPALSQ
ncbi:MAG: tetratricopeptide repeat protein [Planctomycetes bacterium]|nr:tetratricopeptide repeat protein [Planctomycetota bacterium]